MPPITLPNLSLESEWAERESGWKPGMEANLRLLDRLVQLSVQDKDLTAPPGAPANGDTYIVGPSATGTWAGHDGDIAVYETILGVAGWSFYAPRAGFVAWLWDEATLYVYQGSSWSKFPGLVSRYLWIPYSQFGYNAVARTSPVDEGVAEYISLPAAGDTDLSTYVTIPEGFGSVTSWKAFFAMSGTDATNVTVTFGYTVLSAGDFIDEVTSFLSQAITPGGGGAHLLGKITLSPPASPPALAPGDLVKLHFHRHNSEDANGDDMLFAGILLTYQTA